MSSALSLLKLNEMDEKEKRWLKLEQNNDLIKSMLDYVKLANEFLENNKLNEINKTEEECDTLAKWFSTHYHCLYVPPYRESQKKMQTAILIYRSGGHCALRAHSWHNPNTMTP